MARRKEKPIETVKHGPFEVVIRMDKDGIFSAEYGTQSHSGALLEVREWCRSRLRELCVLKWEPIISVSTDYEDQSVNNLRNASNLTCYIERHWIAWDGSKWIQAPWVVMPRGSVLCSGPNRSEMNQDHHSMPDDELNERRIANSRDFSEAPAFPKIKWPIVNESGLDRSTYIEYTEERWQTMIGILDKIRELRAGINRLLSSEQGWLRLAEVAKVKLLS